MNEIPMSQRDHTNYDKKDFTCISKWKQIPLPENNSIMKYLKKNFKPLKNLSCKIVGQPAYSRQIKPLPCYESDVITSEVVKNDLIIHVCSSEFDANIYIHIPKEHLDDPDPMCDFSMITQMGALSKEGLYFSEIVNRINGEVESLEKLAKTI